MALGETQAVLGDPDLAYLFAPDTLAEVRVSAEIPEMDGRVMDGIIDRSIKTNFVVPETAEQTPIGVLRQLGAYRSAVLQIYPDRGVDVAVLWTATRQLMTIDHDIVMQALQSATTS